jgi:hypothetical protein
MQMAEAGSSGNPVSMFAIHEMIARSIDMHRAGSSRSGDV